MAGRDCEAGVRAARRVQREDVLRPHLPRGLPVRGREVPDPAGQHWSEPWMPLIANSSQKMINK